MDADKNREAVTEAIENAFNGDALKKAVFSRPKDGKVIKAVAAVFLKNGEKKVKLEVFMKDGKAIQKIFGIKEFITEFAAKAYGAYRQIDLTAKDRSAGILISEKGRIHFSGTLDGAERFLPSESQDKEKRYILTKENGKDFLFALGILGKNGEIHDKKQSKYRQINRFLEYVESVSGIFGDKDELCVCDLCCGKSYLTFAVYWYLTEVLGKRVRMYGVDLKKDVIGYCSEVAKRLGFNGLHFECGDVSRFSPPEPPDLVISLHACDVATDYVLAGAVRAKARVILSTPCCQHELNGQISCDALSVVTEHSLLKQRLASAATDALRAKMLEVYGYKVNICELIDPEETPKNLLIRAVKTDRGSAVKRERLIGEYADACRFLGVKPKLSELLELPKVEKLTAVETLFVTEEG